jgi:membrane protein DedA with SNARE-associated domain/rhodanese-related sulfurtransferase
LSSPALAGQDLSVASPIGLSVVFLNVLCNQLGLPIPVVPTLVLAGALAAAGRLPAGALFCVAVAGCVIGDSVWYGAGRVFGGRVMNLLCRISLTPDTCVSQTQTSFERWGSKILIVAKFVPGLSLVAPPLAGATRMSVVRFLSFSTLAAALWVAVVLISGALLRAQVEWLLPHLVALGGKAISVILVLLAAYVAYKGWERYRFNKALDMARISVAELYEHMAAGAAPVVLDVRSVTAQGLQRRRIPGALHVPLQQVGQHVSKLPRDRDIILYCSCPHEASAAQAAKVLMSHGFQRVRPLKGGLEAWIAAGYAVEECVATSAGTAPVAALAPQPSAPLR